MSSGADPVPGPGPGRLAVLTSPFAVGVGARIAVQIIAFAQIMIAARYVDLSGFGTYTLGWAVCVIAVSFVYTGFYQALLRDPAFDAAKNSGFWAMAAIGALGGGAMALVGAVLGAGTPIGLVFLLLAPIPAARAHVAWAEAHLVRDRRVRLVSLYGLASEAAALAVVILGLRAGWGLFALVAGRHAALLVEGAVALAASRAWPGRGASRARLASLRQTALPLWGTSALGMFANYGADLILGVFLNTAAVGAYRSAARISQTAADLIFQPLNTLSWSRLSQLDKAGQRAGFKAVWLEHMGFGAIVLMPILVAFAMLAPELVVFLFDASWLAAAPVIAILCLSRGLAFFASLLEPVLSCQGRGRAQLWVRGIAALVTLAALVLFGRFGAEAAAGAHALASGVAAVLALAVMIPSMQISLWEAARAHAPAAALSLACALGLLATESLRSRFGLAAEVLSAVALLALIWGTGVAWCLRRGAVVLPKP